MMKMQKNITVLILMTMALLTASAVMAGNAPKTKAECLTTAEKYDKLAAEQEAVVKEHKEMKTDYRSNQATLGKQVREKALADMDKHCDAIITAAQKLADEYKAMAQWHKIHADDMMQ